MRLNSGMFVLDFPALVSFTPVSFGVCLGPAAEEFSRGAEWEWLQGGSSWWSCCTHTAGSMSLALGISYICMLLCYITWTVHRCSLLLHTHTHPFNGRLPGTTRVSRYQKGKTNLDFTEARDSEWQWHQLGHMQVCISLRTDNHASTPPLSFFTGRMPFWPPNQQRQSTVAYCYK